MLGRSKGLLVRGLIGKTTGIGSGCGLGASAIGDLLAHIVAWHESFALNVSLLASGQDPQPPRGSLRLVNREGVIALRDKTVPQLIRKLRKAQRTIEKHIFDESIGQIPYRQPGTSYTRVQHLDVVRGHIHDHFWEAIDKYVAATKTDHHPSQ